MENRVIGEEWEEKVEEGLTRHWPEGTVGRAMFCSTGNYGTSVEGSLRPESTVRVHGTVHDDLGSLLENRGSGQ